MSEYRLEYSFEETVKKMTKEVQRKVEQEILDANAHVLEEFGYVKVVRCRDCVHAEPEGEPPRKGCEGLLWCDYLTEGIGFSVLPHNFCAWGKRKEGGE